MLLTLHEDGWRRRDDELLIAVLFLTPHGDGWQVRLHRFDDAFGRLLTPHEEGWPRSLLRVVEPLAAS